MRALVASLLALTLAGCLSTQDEPFSLVGGDSVAAQPGDYACRTVDERGAAKVERGRLVRLRSDRRTQYVFLAPDNSSAEPATLHRVADGVYLVAVAHAEGPGEDLYLAAVAADGARSGFMTRRAALAAAPALASAAARRLPTPPSATNFPARSRRNARSRWPSPATSRTGASPPTAACADGHPGLAPSQTGGRTPPAPPS